MAKGLCYAGTAVAGLLLLLFGLDLAVAIPFKGGSMAMDIGMIVSAMLLGYVSWITLREQKS